MESNIKIKATVSEMKDFFEQDHGVRFYKIDDKRYTQADLDAMSEEKYQSERFKFSVVYRHMELDKPLSGTFTISGLKKKMSDIHEAEQHPPLYLQSATYAVEHGEREEYRASRRANIACRDAIEKAISANYSNNHLETEAIYKSIHEQFGSERMKYVLAATVQYKDWDGRFSSDNKAWAKSAFTSDIERDRIHEFTVNQSHPVLVDALVTRARKEFAKEQEQQKPSVLDKLQKPTETAKASVKKTKELSL